MTTTDTCTDTDQVVLKADDARDLVRVLDRVEDWLRHAGYDAREDLAAFLNAPDNGHLAAAGVIELLGAHAAALHRQIRQAGR